MNTHAHIASANARPDSKLEHFPVPLFASVMGTTGLAIAWQKAHAVLGAPALVGDVVRMLASLLFVFLAATYALKWLRHRAAALAETRHPVRIHFVSAISISLLLLSTSWISVAPRPAATAWAAAAMLHLALTMRTISSWIHHTHYDIKHVNPSWFIPVVGNIIVPIAGVKIASPELSWFFFSIGIVFWGVMLTIVMYRLFFHDALPAKLAPTMFILLAPPSVGFVAWTELAGGVDAFGRILFYIALFLALVLASDAMRFIKLPFFISSWAYSFPLAALTIASITMFQHVGGTTLAVIALALLALLSIVLALLAARTIMAAWRNQICIPE